MTNQVTIGENFYYACSCGHMMMYLNPSGERLMACTNRECKHFQIAYKAPVFEVEPAEQT